MFSGLLLCGHRSEILKQAAEEICVTEGEFHVPNTMIDLGCVVWLSCIFLLVTSLTGLGIEPMDDVEGGASSGCCDGSSDDGAPAEEEDEEDGGERSGSRSLLLFFSSSTPSQGRRAAGTV